MGCELNLCWFYWLEIGFGWKFGKMDSPGSSDLEGELLVKEQCPHPCGFCINNLIARHHTHPTARLPPPAYAWVAPWFHHADTNPTVPWNPEHKPQRLFTATLTWPRPDPTGIATRYSMHEPGR